MYLNSDMLPVHFLCDRHDHIRDRLHYEICSFGVNVDYRTRDTFPMPSELLYSNEISCWYSNEAFGSKQKLRDVTDYFLVVYVSLLSDQNFSQVRKVAIHSAFWTLTGDGRLADHFI